MSRLVDELVDEPMPLVPVPQQDIGPNMMQQAHSSYGFAVNTMQHDLPDPRYMHRSFFAKLLSMVTDHSVVQRVAQFPMIQRYTEGITPGTSGLPYVLDISLNTETLCVYKPFLPEGQSYFDASLYPVYFCFAGTHTAWDAMRAAVLTATGSNYDTHFDAFKVAIVAYVAANPALFPNDVRPIHLLGFSMGATAAIWAQTVLSELWPNRQVFATVFNPYVGHLALTSNTGKRGRDTTALNQWHQDRLQYLKSHTITPDHYVWRVNSNCIVGEDGSKYWADFDESSDPLFWGKCYMFDALFDDGSGISASFLLGQKHSIKQWTGTQKNVPITTDAGPAVIETTMAEIVAGVYKISGNALHNVAVASGSIDTSLVLTAQVDPAAPGTMIQYPSTQFMEDTALSVAQYTTLGQSFGVVPHNVDADEYTIRFTGDPTVMQPLECLIKAVPGHDQCFTVQRRSDGKYMATHEIGTGGSYTLADKGPVDWEPQPADTSSVNLNYLGLIWKFSPLVLADTDPTHRRGPRRAIQPELYDVLPQDGTIEKYTIKHTDASHSSGGSMDFYLSLGPTSSGGLYGLNLENMVAGWSTPPPTWDQDVDYPKDESLWTVQSLYSSNHTPYMVQIESTLKTEYSNNFPGASVTNAMLTNVAAPMPTTADARIAQIDSASFTYIDATSFSCKLRVANLPTASSYLRFTESGSSSAGNGYYGSYDFSTAANATVLTFAKVTSVVTTASTS